MIKKLSWAEKAKDLMEVYKTNLRKDPEFSYRKLAAATGFSLGTVGIYLTIASWLVTHEKELLKLKTAKQAMDFIKKKELERKTR